MSSPPKCRQKKLIITQINDSQFLIEGNADKTKIGGESEYAISYIDFDNGPLIHVGNDFLGRGRVVSVDLVDTNKPNYIIVKVSLEEVKESL